jgi:hypothetical protein
MTESNNKKIFFIVTTSEFSSGFFIHSKYDQIHKMHSHQRKEQALNICAELNKKANEQFNPSIILTTNKKFSLGVKEFITNY